MKKLIKPLLIAAMTSLCATNLWAQRNDAELARKLFDFIKAGQGDSVYVYVNENFKNHVPLDALSTSFRQLERSYGKYSSHGEWKTDSVGATVVHYTDVQLEKYAMRFFASFDHEGKAAGLQFLPKPEPSDVPPVKFDRRKMTEEPMDVGTGNHKLPGTLTLPKGVKDAPVVILVHGSGSHDRDESIGPNKPFRDLAWALAARGIAVLRYDKRSFVYAQQQAADTQLTYETETVNDALLAVDAVRAHKKLARSRVYVAGHSLGATLAPRIAERDSTLAGIILIAAAARPLEDLLVHQYEYLSTLSGQDAKAHIADMKARAANVKKLGTDAYDATVPFPFNAPQSYWQYANGYKPVEVARALTLPILVLQGERDYQVTMQDFGLWRMGLFRNRNVRFRSYPKLNHLLQEGTGKSMPMEYGQEASVPGYVPDDIARWIKTNQLDD